MVKHNNVLPNQHFHKKWQRRVRTWFDQPAKKKARRQARQLKAAKMAPRPTQLLRPGVHCPTIKYNSKVRLGRGFNMDELKEAGLSKKTALTIGIAVDHRRTSKSEATFQSNVARLKEYRANLIVFPRGPKNDPKKGDSSLDQQASATQLMDSKRAKSRHDVKPDVNCSLRCVNNVDRCPKNTVTGVTMPLVKAKKPVEFVDVTAEMKGTNLHSERRIARNESKVAGIRLRQKADKDAAK